MSNLEESSINDPNDENDDEDLKDEIGSSGGDEKKICESKKTQRRESHNEAFWYKLCERYKQYQEENPGKNCSQRSFLKSKEALEVTGAPRECRSFSRYWRRYERGELNPTSSRRRRRAVGYVEIEERLSTYLQLRADIFVRGDINGATWAKLKQKCVKWGAKELKELQARETTSLDVEDGESDEVAMVTHNDYEKLAEASGEEKVEKKYSDFRASPGWLHKVLKRNNIESKYLQSEMDSKDEHSAMEEWIPNFHQTILDVNISGSCLYNAASTSLFYRQLPSTRHQRKQRKQHVPTNERISLMICTAADGTKVPLAAVGNEASCFLDSEDEDDNDDDDDDDGEEEGQNTNKEHEKKKKRSRKEGSKPKSDSPLAYTSQPNAWFDQETTLWWIHNVFWLFHTQQHGDVPCILLMDHCPANIDLEKIEYERPFPPNLKIFHFPVKMSRRRHPAEGGTIGTLKLGYKLKMASSVLALFDLFGGFQGAQDRYYGRNNSNHKERGTGGLACGDPATLLDALHILKQVWNSNNKFATNTLILEGWKKARLLPSWWEEEIDVWIRNGATPRIRCKEGWADHDRVQLCHVLQSLAAKAEEAGLEKSQLESSALKGSFVLMQREGDSFRPDRDEDVWDMASAWIEIEDDLVVREHILEYECEQVLVSRKHALAIQKQMKEEEEQKEEDQVATRFERVLEGLEEAKDYAQFLGMDEKVLNLIDRFENKLCQMVKKLQKVKMIDGRRKRVKLNAEHTDPGDESIEP